ncbi:unnamed protein product [Heligmosomoides polygyrus]|uniref:DUF2088 domain-containing protein n=1 Tax=Heligmosomoides polygyrus TaxID=6339 RepID=A0A183FPD7_HELPZ|nr:unnamed protein product [Heligmosomoides polygyrus]
MKHLVGQVAKRAGDRIEVPCKIRPLPPVVAFFELLSDGLRSFSLIAVALSGRFGGFPPERRHDLYIDPSFIKQYT